LGNKNGSTRLKESTEKKIEDYFFEGGITTYQVARILHCDHKTITSRWNNIADTIVTNENHQDWYEREERVRTRALEDQSCQVKTQRKMLEPFVTLLESIPKERKNLEDLERVEKIVRLNRTILSELIDEYDAIEMTPPMRIILERETEVRIAAKQGIKEKEQSTDSR